MTCGRRRDRRSPDAEREVSPALRRFKGVARSLLSRAASGRPHSARR